MTRSITRMTLEDAEHYSAQQRTDIINSYPEHERDARAKGIPTLGSGRVFPLRDEDVMCDPVPLAKHWPRINGLDFGWDHPFAACANAWDRDADIWYVTAIYRSRQSTPVIHSAAIKPWGDWIPWAWPHDGLQHDKGSGKQLASLYRDQGLNLLAEHATHEAEGSAQTQSATMGGGGTGVEAGVIEMLDRMKTGRFKVFAHLAEWFSEFRLYHREDGKIVKEHDDLLCASRYALMMKRYAETEPTATKITIPRWMG